MNSASQEHEPDTAERSLLLLILAFFVSAPGSSGWEGWDTVVSVLFGPVFYSFRFYYCTQWVPASDDKMRFNF